MYTTIYIILTGKYSSRKIIFCIDSGGHLKYLQSYLMSSGMVGTLIRMIYLNGSTTTLIVNACNELKISN